MMPVPIVDPDGAFRALTVHDVVPADHIGVLVLRSDWDPHLKVGEVAILDPSDTEPQVGELYGLMIGTAEPKLKVVQPYRSCLSGDDGAVMFRFSDVRPGRMAYADGPLALEWWHRKCRGRIVGVMLPEVAYA